MKAAAALFAAALGCAGRARPAAGVEVVALPPAARTVRPPWRSLVSRSLPTPLRALAARDADSAVVVAADRAFILRGDEVSTLCDESLDEGDLVLGAAVSGPASLLLGVRDRRAVIWRAVEGEPCAVVTTPDALGAEAPESLSLYARGSTAWVWSISGRVWRSSSEGAAWIALPPLPRVTRVFAGPDGGSWAATSAGAPWNPRDGAAHRGRVLRLDESSSPRWVPVAEDRLLPVASSPRRDGAWLVADGGDLSVASPRAGLRRELWLPWSRTRADAPSAIVDAGDGRFFASAGRMLYRVDSAGVQPLGTLPGGAAAHSIAASDDGALWAMDPQTVWQAGADARWRDRTRRPWAAGGVLAARARGDFCAVATDDGRLVIRDASADRWVALDVPRAQGRVIALEINEAGTVLGVCERGAVMGDARGITPLDAPFDRAGMDETPSAHAIGDRWVLLRGGVWTSDDEGATWQPRLANPSVHGASARPVSNLVVATGHALAMDEDFNLWRSDDGAATWRRLRTETPWPGAEPPRWNSGRPLLAWDGRARVALFARNVLAVSDDHGAHWEARAMNALATGLAVRPDGALFVSVGTAGSGNRACDGAQGVALFGGDTRWFGLLRDACDHLGDAVHLDGERGEALVVRRGGVAWLGDLDALRDPAAPRIY